MDMPEIIGASGPVTPTGGCPGIATSPCPRVNLNARNRLVLAPEMRAVAIPWTSLPVRVLIHGGSGVRFQTNTVVHHAGQSQVLIATAAGRSCA